MKKILLASMICAVSMSVSAFAADPDAATIFRDAKIKAEADYKIASVKCTSMTDNAKDVCVAEAKSARIHAEENAQADFNNTLSSRTSAIKKIADADYEVDKAKCMAMVGNEKDVCIKKAKSTKVAAVATAKADKKVIEARSDEAQDKKNAEYKVAIEKCDAMTGTVKDICISNAKKKFGK